MTLKRVQEIQNMQRSLALFVDSVDSTATLDLYQRGLQVYMKFVGYENRYDDYVRLDSEVIQRDLENYVRFHSKRGIKRVTVSGYLKPVKLFLDMNRVPYFPKILSKLNKGLKTKKGNGVPFTDDDINSMIDYTNSSRNKAIILFFSSVGGRPAVLTDPVLRFKHLYSMPHGCKAVLVYACSEEEYWSFLTPEATQALEYYRDERIRNGENITPESPLFVIEKKHNRGDETHMSLDALYSLMYNIQKKANIEKIKSGQRNDKAVFYGFRKRFNTILKINNDVNSNIAEKLMAHKKGLDGVYLKPTREECFAEFIKAVPQITVSKASKLSLKLAESEADKDEKIKMLQQEMKGIYKLLERINPSSIAES